jgi:hypothetical protein
VRLFFVCALVLVSRHTAIRDPRDRRESVADALGTSLRYPVVDSGFTAGSNSIDDGSGIAAHVNVADSQVVSQRCDRLRTGNECPKFDVGTRHERRQLSGALGEWLPFFYYVADCGPARVGVVRPVPNASVEPEHER